MQSPPEGKSDFPDTPEPPDGAQPRLGLGTALATLSRSLGLTNADLEALGQTRDPCPAEPARPE